MSQFAPHTELLEMLSYARPHGSATEQAFVERFIQPLDGVGFDKFGNGILRIGSAPVLWSCHTDTVHAHEGRQRVTIAGDLVSLVKRKRGRVLGADDSAGVWLMSEMVRAKVPGLYVFHSGEEVGGLGSDWLAKNRPDLLTGINYAIALDRKGKDSVITHQGARCCSDAFAAALARKLNGTDHTFRFTPDDTGLFTDTANYTDLIGECTNLSVGYEHAHSADETLDIAFLLRLRDVLLSFDCTDLPAQRKPGDYDTEEFLGPQWGTKKLTAVPTYDAALVELCRNYPEMAAKLIEELGGNGDDMLNLLWSEGYDV